MKYSDYEGLINDLLENRDDLSKVDILKEKLKEDLNVYESTVEEHNKSIEKIKELQETNLKLYLNLSKGTVEKTEEVEEAKSPKELFNETFKKYLYKEGEN